jgi:DNA-binding TFAR19-related protein (PDSD5 family)
MATTATGTTEQSREQDKARPQIVVVDLDQPQSAERVKRLRKGRGRLMNRVERIVGDLIQAGTLKSTAQPVVIVVREIPASPWSFGSSDDDDDDD